MRTLVRVKFPVTFIRKRPLGNAKEPPGNKTKIVIQNRNDAAGSELRSEASSGGARLRSPSSNAVVEQPERNGMIGFALAKSNTPAGGHKVQAGLGGPAVGHPIHGEWRRDVARSDEPNILPARWFQTTVAELMSTSIRGVGASTSRRTKPRPALTIHGQDVAFDEHVAARFRGQRIARTPTPGAREGDGICAVG